MMQTTMRAMAATLLCLGPTALLPGCTALLGGVEQPAFRSAPAQPVKSLGASSGSDCLNTPRGIAGGIAGGMFGVAVGTFVPVPGFQLASLDAGARMGCWIAAQLPVINGRPTVPAPNTLMPRAPELSEEEDPMETQLAQLR